MASEGEPYCFPDTFTNYFRNKYLIPAVYRWRVMKIEGQTREAVYIGEAEDLVRRIQRVRTPSRKGKESDTNKRLNKIFHEYLSAGRRIVLDTADIDPFEINEIRFGSDTLGDRFKRRAMENILLAITQRSESYELLNITVDPLEKVRQALATLPPHVVREIVKQYRLKTQQ